MVKSSLVMKQEENNSAAQQQSDEFQNLQFQEQIRANASIFQVKKQSALDHLQSCMGKIVAAEYGDCDQEYLQYSTAYIIRKNLIICPASALISKKTFKVFTYLFFVPYEELKKHQTFDFHNQQINRTKVTNYHISQSDFDQMSDRDQQGMLKIKEGGVAFCEIQDEEKIIKETQLLNINFNYKYSESTKKQEILICGFHEQQFDSSKMFYWEKSEILRQEQNRKIYYKHFPRSVYFETPILAQYSEGKYQIIGFHEGMCIQGSSGMLMQWSFHFFYVCHHFKNGYEIDFVQLQKRSFNQLLESYIRKTFQSKLHSEQSNQQASQLLQQSQRLQLENINLQNMLSSQQGQRQSLIQQNIHQQTIITQLQQQFQQVKQQKINQQNTIQQLQRRIQQLERSRNGPRILNMNIIKELRQKMKNLEDGNRLKEEQVYKLNKTVLRLNQQKTLLEGQKKQLKEQALAFKEQATSLRGQLQNLNGQIQNLNEQIQLQRQQITTLNKQIETLNGQNSGLIQQIATLNGAVASLNGQIQIKRDQAATLNDQVEELNRQIQTLNGQVETLNKETRLLRGQVLSLKNTVSERNQTIKSKSQQLKQRLLIIEQMKRLLKKQETLYDQLKESYKILEISLKEKTQQLKAKKKQYELGLRQKEEQIIQLGNQKNFFQQRSIQQAQKIKLMLAQIQRFKETITSLQNKNHSNETALQEKDDEIEELRAEIQTIKEQKNKLSNDSQVLQKKLRNPKGVQSAREIFNHQVDPNQRIQNPQINRPCRMIPEKQQILGKQVTVSNHYQKTVLMNNSTHEQEQQNIQNNQPTDDTQGCCLFRNILSPCNNKVSTSAKIQEKLSQIKQLYLEELKIGLKPAMDFVKSIYNQKNLDDKSIDDKYFKNFTKRIEETQKDYQLKLTKNGYNLQWDIEKFFEYDWMNLEVLCISQSKIDDVKWKLLCQMGEKFLPNLKTLYLASNVTEVKKEDLDRLWSVERIWLKRNGGSPGLTEQSRNQIRKFIHQKWDKYQLQVKAYQLIMCQQN